MKMWAEWLEISLFLLYEIKTMIDQKQLANVEYLKYFGTFEEQETNLM